MRRLIGRSDLAETTVELFDRFMAVNIRAPLFLDQGGPAAPRSPRTGRCSTSARSTPTVARSICFPTASPKGACRRCRKIWPTRLGGKVRVNHFNVGWVLTPNEYHYKIMDGFPADWPEHVGPPNSPNNRLIKPEEIAAAAVYWLSDESIAISGSVLDLEQYPFRRPQFIKPSTMTWSGTVDCAPAWTANLSHSLLSRQEPNDAPTRRLSQSIFGFAVRRRIDDGPPVD